MPYWIRYAFPKNLKAILFCFAISLASAIYSQDSAKTEFRGVWIATVSNIDWPTRPTLNSFELRRSFTTLLETHYRNGFNAIVFQIRPATDAFYPSPFEPWSEWLTGEQGQAPVPYYDPLEFMITETHKRGMQFHAWMNPYRAVFNLRTSSITPGHVTNVHPEWFVRYANKKFFDPGNKEAQAYVTRVVRDVVKRYDVDAIHFDDYFYPYPEGGREFPDERTFHLYGNGMSRADWRRSNTDSIMSSLYHVIKETRPDCQFGVSPFGVWRNIDKDPEGSNTKAGPTNYDVLYADILLWLKKGWVDYIAPQIYWEIGHRAAAYEVLVDWWNAHTYGVNCYIGIGSYRANSNTAWRDKNQLPMQVRKVRDASNLKGMIFYSSNSLERNLNGWGDSLRLNYFKEPADIPVPERLLNDN